MFEESDDDFYGPPNLTGSSLCPVRNLDAASSRSARSDSAAEKLRERAIRHRERIDTQDSPICQSRNEASHPQTNVAPFPEWTASEWNRRSAESRNVAGSGPWNSGQQRRRNAGPSN